MKARYPVYITLNDAEIVELHKLKGKNSYKQIFMLGLEVLKKEKKEGEKDEGQENSQN